jgi:hypothetical protein
VAERLAHHDLCFGCGQANLFGLQLELERTDDGVTGRFFVKQDHQGAPGLAHVGVLVAALEEAMEHVGDGPAGRLEVELLSPVPIGTFVQVNARQEGGELVAEALGDDGKRVASARRQAGE